MRQPIANDRKASPNTVREKNREEANGFAPIRIVETEIGQPLPEIVAFDHKSGQYCQRALCLIRLHTRPLGIIELQLDERGLSASEYARRIWDTLHVPIVKHLQEDGLPVKTGLDVRGLSSILPPQCVVERELFFQTAPFVSIIVATRDHPECLTRCLQSLMALHYPYYEVIVVDDAPTTTATADFIQQAYPSEPKIKYVRENRPGLSWARNCGMSVAKGEIIAFTDDDVVVDSYWLAELVKAFGCGDSVACVTGLVLPLELEAQAQVWFEEFGGLNKGFTRRIFDRTGNYANIPLYPFATGHFGAGASMAFTSAFLHSICGFDPALGTGTRTGGGEDLAAFFQVIKSGNKLVYQPAALLYHLHRRDYVRLRKQIYYYGAGLIAFLTKVVLDNPSLLFSLIVKVPYGLFFILSSRSPKNRKRSKDYPKDLIILERKGMLYGPFAYLRSRWEMRKLRRTRMLGEICTINSRRIIRIVKLFLCQ